MVLKIDMSGEIPIYIQLRNEIVKGIGRGELSPGENLPTVRQLASELGVNTMTVSKAYQLLKSEGFIETDRRKGAVVKPAQTMGESAAAGSWQWIRKRRCSPAEWDCLRGGICFSVC